MNIMKYKLSGLVLTLTLSIGFTQPVVGAGASAVAWSSVTDQNLLNADTSDDWLIYGRSYKSDRHSPLKQINLDNIKDLKPVFVQSLGSLEGQQVTPSVNKGIMVVAISSEYVDAIDAKTGERLWRYTIELPEDVTQFACCGKVAKGVGLYGDRVFVATMDARIIALDAKTGEEIWEKTLEDYKLGYGFSMAPMIANGKVIIGFAGGEFGVIGQILALDTKTGDIVWKHRTIPIKGEPGYETWGKDSAVYGGGAAWNTASFDPELNLIYMGTGNPAPWNADQRPGDNLFTNSMLALDADTGKRKWYFQFVQNDAWDWDAMNEAVLIDLEVKGKTIKAMIHANKNGHLYVLDRTNGHFIHSNNFTTTNWGKVDQKTGKMIVEDGKRPSLNVYASVCPSFFGGKGLAPLSYNPDTGVAFIPAIDMCMKMKHESTEYTKGTMYLGAAAEMDGPGKGHLAAFDVANNKVLWKWENISPLQSSGSLNTAGDLVFLGTFEGNLVAINQKNGKEVWKFKTGSAIIGAPISYAVDGKQYIAVVSGYGGAFPLWAGAGVPEHLKQINIGASLTVFAVD